MAGSDSGNFVFDQRIVTKALRDIGPLAFLPTASRSRAACSTRWCISDGRKMSKHLGNVVDPDELVRATARTRCAWRSLYAARPQRRSTGATRRCCAAIAS